VALAGVVLVAATAAEEVESDQLWHLLRRLSCVAMFQAAVRKWTEYPVKPKQKRHPGRVPLLFSTPEA